MIRSTLFSLAIALAALFAAAPLSAGQQYVFVTTPFLPFTNPEDKQDGFLGQIAHEVLARQGHELRIEYRPWARALAEATSGDFDGLLSAYYTEERGEFFHFSAPLNTTGMVLAGLTARLGGKNRYHHLQEFAGKDIATGRKWAYSENFDAYEGFRRIEVGTEESGIRMLFAERVDLFAVNIDQFRSVIRRLPDYNLDAITILEPPISSNDQHLAVSRQVPHGLQLLADFNTGLAALKASGRYDSIRQKYF